MGFDKNDVAGQCRGEPSRRILAQGTAAGDEAHVTSFTNSSPSVTSLRSRMTGAKKGCNGGARASSGERGGMKRLNGVDALMLYSETPEIHMHTLKIGVLDVSGVDGFDFDLFKTVAYPRLMALTPLRYQLVDIPLKLHHPMWVENDDIDLDYHVHQACVCQHRAGAVNSMS